MNYEDMPASTHSCPVCGAEPQYRTWRRFVNSSYTHVISDAHKIVGSNLTPLVCTRCGYVQIFVDPTDFSTDQQQ